MVILQQCFYYHSQTAVNKNFTKKRDIRYDSYSKTLSLEIKMCMKRYLHFLLIIIWFLKPPASTLSQTQTSAGDSLYAVYLLSVIAPQPDIAHYVTAYAHLLEGTTYTAGTLDRDSVEKLQPYLQETDCTTFVETVLALARTAVKKQSTWDEYCRQLTALRYRNGKIDGYLSRLHYFSDWIANNEQKGFVTDITKISGGVPDTLRLYFMSRNADRYPALQRNATLVDGIAVQERSLNGKIIYYLPTFRLDSASLATIQSGDIIAFTTDIPRPRHSPCRNRHTKQRRSASNTRLIESRSCHRRKSLHSATTQRQQKIFGHTHYSTPKFRKPEIMALFIFFVSFFFNIIKYFYLCPRNRSHENGKNKNLSNR